VKSEDIHDAASDQEHLSPSVRTPRHNAMNNIIEPAPISTRDTTPVADTKTVTEVSPKGAESTLPHENNKRGHVTKAKIR
jgi:hypothetical protein